MSPHARAWQRMLSGRRLDLLDPSPLDIEIEDIAHGLARVARWNGQTTGEHALSVAQHSLAVESIAAQLSADLAPEWRLAALLHDGPEYVIGDMISPFKSALGLSYKAFEARLEAAIHRRFGLTASTPADIARLIKRADRISAHIEAVTLAGFEEKEAGRLFGARLRAVVVDLDPWSAPVAQARYLARFAALQADRVGRDDRATG